MQHNPMLMANIEIERAQLQAQARDERRAKQAAKETGSRRGLLGRLRRR
jgi:hypothetical protein